MNILNEKYFKEQALTVNESTEDYRVANESKSISFKELKKKKDLMNKWKIGAKYIKGFKDFKNGRSRNLTIYELVDYKPSVRYEDPDDGSIDYDLQLTLKDINSNKKIEIDQDDRYGNYALLDNSRKANIIDTYEEAKATVSALESIFKHIK
jgi:hypothetical protein